MPYARGQPIILGGSTYYVQEPKDKNVAGIFAFFLGGLGIHHFYNRQPGWGIVYVLFVWTGIPSIIAFFEALWFWFSAEESFYNHHKHLLTGAPRVAWQNGAPAPFAAPAGPAAPVAWPEPATESATTNSGQPKHELFEWKHMLDAGIIT